jgi:hypothetical protein
LLSPFLFFFFLFVSPSKTVRGYRHRLYR